MSFPPSNDVRALVDVVKAANPVATLAIGCFVAAGSGPAIEQAKKTFGNGPLAGLAGSPAEVVDTLRGYERFGIDRCMIGELAPGSLDALANHLF